TTLVAQAVAHGDLDFEAGLTAAHHRLARTQHDDADGRIREEWQLAHREFHQTMLSGSPNRRLQGIANSLRDQAEIYRCWARTLGGDTRRDTAGEHRALMEAVLDRDADRATTLLARHIQRAM